MNIRHCLILFCAISLTSCASTPKGAATLSQLVGADITELQSSYLTLTSAHFDSLRGQVNSFIDYQWKPAYLRRFVVEGKLVEAAQMGDPDDVLERVSYWADLAVRRIETKRRELLDPIDRDEKILVGQVNQAFGRVISANSAITAHLQSLEEVQEIQDSILEKFDVKDLRDQINNSLIEISNKTAVAINATAKAEGLIEGATSLIQPTNEDRP